MKVKNSYVFRYLIKKKFLLPLFLMFNIYIYWDNIIYYMAAPEYYIVFDNINKTFETMDKKGNTKILLIDKDILSCSNSIEVNSKLLFLVNYDGKSYLYIFDLKRNTIIYKVPLSGVKGVITNRIYLVNNKIHINYRATYLNEYYYGKNQYDLKYEIPIHDILNLKSIEPLDFDTHKYHASLPTKVKDYYLFYDPVYIETAFKNNSQIIYQYNNMIINYKAKGNSVYQHESLNILTQGEYFLNNKILTGVYIDYWDDEEVLRFEGVYDKKFILFKSYIQSNDIKHGKLFNQGPFIVYCLNNKILKKISLPIQIFNNKQILYIGT